MMMKAASSSGCCLVLALLGLHHMVALGAPSVPDESSYCALAKRIVPDVLDKALNRLDTDVNGTSGPMDVKPLRQAVLLAREAMDIFAFAYPKSCPLVKLKQKTNTIDVWQRLRRDLNVGYELLGDFQDLDHSGVDYTDRDVETRRAKCLQWKEQFKANIPRLHYPEFVQQVVCDQMVQHQHTSRLFWGYGGVLPRLEVSGLANIVRMLRASQLPQIVTAYTQLADIKHVYDDPEHANFHMFRKLIRSVLAVVDLFPELISKPSLAALPKGGKQPAGAKTPASASRIHASKDHTSKSTARRKLAAAQLSGTARKVVAAVKKGQRKAISTRTAARVSLLYGCKDSNQVVDQLRVLFKNLGQVNNKAFAYQFYKNKGDAGLAAKARQQCDEEWADVQAWMVDQKLEQQLTCLRSSLVLRAWART